MGLVSPCGCEFGEFGLCQASAICRGLYSQVIGLSFREDVREDLTTGVSERCWLRASSWRSRLGLVERKDATINISRRLPSVFSLLFASSGYSVTYSGVRDRVCGLALGLAGELSPRASPGFGKRVIDQLDRLREHTVLSDFDFDAR